MHFNFFPKKDLVSQSYFSWPETENDPGRCTFLKVIVFKICQDLLEKASIHSFSIPASSWTRCSGGLLEPLPAVIGRTQGYTLDKSPVWQKQQPWNAVESFWAYWAQMPYWLKLHNLHLQFTFGQVPSTMVSVAMPGELSLSLHSHHNVSLDLLAVLVKDIPKEIMSNFWSNVSEIR